jgi:signal transduction histidine kinase
VSTRTRLRNSLAVTFTSRIFGFASLVILGVVGYVLWHEQQVLNTELQRRAFLMANQLARESVDPILREDDYALFRQLRLLRGNPQANGAGRDRIAYAMILDPHGQALAHTDPARVHTALTDARTREILARPEPSLRAIITPDGTRLYDVAVPIRMRGLPVGAVRLGISRAGTDRTVADLALKVVAVLFGLMLIGLGSIWRFSRRMVQPIQRLRDGARAVQAGDLTQRVPADRPDEIGELASAFNAMTEELARSHAALEHKEVLRARLLEQVITAQEDERKRIARELHDETSQALTSLMVGLKVLEQQPDLTGTRETFGHLRALTSKTLDAVHDLALRLRPSVLDDLGLVAALDRAVVDFHQRHGIPTTFETNLRSAPRLPGPLETALYRITQEALTNVARHADAHAVSLLLEARRTAVTLIVEDDGCGFDAPQALGAARDERNLGLVGMRERATLLGGQLTIESAPGTGTTVYVEIPLPMEIPDDAPQTDPYPAGG